MILSLNPNAPDRRLLDEGRRTRAMTWIMSIMLFLTVLSGGEQQRIAIARAVIGRPEVLVADEPTGNVDPDMAERLLHLFDSLNRLGTTVVVATHDFHLINRIPNAHMMRLEKGQVIDPTGSLRNPPGQA